MEDKLIVARTVFLEVGSIGIYFKGSASTLRQIFFFVLLLLRLYPYISTVRCFSRCFFGFLTTRKMLHFLFFSKCSFKYDINY